MRLNVAIMMKKKNPNPVTYEELEEDLLNLLKPFDSLSRYEGEEFTEEDVVAALQAYDDKGYINYPIDKISQKSGISIQKNKRMVENKSNIYKLIIG